VDWLGFVIGWDWKGPSVRSFEDEVSTGSTIGSEERSESRMVEREGAF
jgi:hypothetical protein